MQSNELFKAFCKEYPDTIRLNDNTIKVLKKDIEWCELLYCSFIRNDTKKAKNLLDILRKEYEQKSLFCTLYLMPTMWDWLKQKCFYEG